MGCVVFPGAIPERIEDGIRGPGFPVEVYNTLGAGDAFMAGFLRGLAEGRADRDCLRLGKCLRRHRRFAAALLAGVSDLRRASAFSRRTAARYRALRHDPELNHVHWVETRRPQPDRLMALAIDHRSQFEALADRLGAPRERIGRFKQLAVEATARVADGREGYGMLIDGLYGTKALHAAADHPFWIGRPVEQPGSRPLEFEGGGDLGAHLAEWPVTQTVKCLCFYHPDDPAELKARQERELLRVFDACRTVGRELMIEIIAGKNGAIADDTIATRDGPALRARHPSRLVEARAAGDAQRRGDSSTRSIETRDPRCRGVVLLGLEAPEEELARGFAVAATSARVRGFAVGRTIFGDAAAAWLAGKHQRRGGDSRHGGAFPPPGRRLAAGVADGARRVSESEEGRTTMQTVRLTAAQALVRFLAAQMTEIDGRKLPIFAGVWAIFGHGNVAAIGEALYAERDRLPTFRGQNEQAMAHAAIAFAKASFRRRMMACTSSIGPGATNMVTAAAVAHVNRLPVLFLPGDVFANRRPDPVLQQVEDFGDGTVSANDCFRPVSRYFDRITRPEQIINALQRAMGVLTDPAECGPVTLALLPGHAGRGVRLPGELLRRAHVGAAARPARRRRTRGGCRAFSRAPRSR